jgi:hypothetical protein
MNQFSLNNRFIVEAYQKEGLKSEVKNGFATIQQKVALKGLKVLVEGRVVHGLSSYIIPKGSTVYVKEERLHSPTGPANKVLSCEAVGQPFIIVDLNDVEFVSLAE